MNQATQNVPALRFPEFEGEWEERKLSDVLVPNFRAVDKPQKQYLALGVRSHTRGTFQKPNSDPNKNSMDTLYEVRANDLIVSITFAWEGAIAIAKESDDYGLVSHRFPTYEFNKSQTTHSFFKHLLKNKKFRFKLELISPGGAGRNRVMSKSNFLKIKNFFPSLPEQQKIASFLSAVDTRVEELRRKHELLQDYKKGVMQQIFNREIRFRDDDGQPFPEWGEKPLSSIANRVTLKNTDSSITDVFTNSATQGVVKQTDYFDKEIANANNLSGYYIISKNDFVYNPRISVSAPVGPIKRNHLGKGIMSPLYTIFRFKNENLSFLESYFQTSFWHKYMKSIANYGARHDRMNVTNDDFLKMPIPYPHPDEQQKIANFLSAIDSKIEAVAAQLAAAQDYKKSLLQQMFI